MGKYVDSALVSNETVLFDGDFALIDNWRWIVVSGGLLFIPIYLIQKTNEIAVTNIRIIGKKGIISRETIDFSLKNIETVNVKQSIFQRIFGFGDITITGSGGSSKEIKAIKSPELFKQSINSARYSN